MVDNTNKSRKIAQNTIVLYLRMILTLVVGLFTSRVILDSLGVVDFGVYNLVGGFVLMFNVFRAGLLAATQRFITYDLGTGNFDELRKTFSTSLIIFVCLSVLIVVLAELFGVWFIEHHLSIPQGRLYAAHWVFQFSLLTLVLSLISYPYNALMIAHEKMSAFAYISIFDVFAKLLVAYVIYVSPFDKLIVYAFLLCIVQIIIRFMYALYCKKHFKESNIVWKIDWSKIKHIYAFTGWELFGSIAVIGYTQGLNLLLGMFFTPVVNAARGIAVQVQGVITGFVTNFQTALNPQITKSYASGDRVYMNNLIFCSSKFSFFLLFALSLPVVFEAEKMLSLWLVEVPVHTVVFLRLIIITTMIDAISNPIITSVEATGNIRMYQIVVGSLLLLILPISYLVLKLGAPPYAVFVVHLVMSFIAFVARLFMGSRAVGFSYVEYIRKVLIPIFRVVLVSVLFPLIAYSLLPNGLTRLFVLSLISIACVICGVYFVGLRDNERDMVRSFLSKCLSRISK